MQDQMKAPESATKISKISKKFKVIMSKGNVNSALKLLKNSMSNGIHSLSNKTLDLLKQEHPLLQDPFRPIHTFPRSFYSQQIDTIR